MSRIGRLFLLAGLGAVLAAPTGSRADEMTWTLKSSYRYRVQVEFYSQSRDHVWPGGGKAWGLNDYDTHEFTLNCISGEKICYGAWVTGNSERYWGVGLNDRHTCSNCCGICGEDDPEMNLTE